MKRLTTTILLVLVSLYAALGQTDSLRLSWQVSGVVLDAPTGRPLQYVSVSVPDKYYATVTNADGFFTLKSDTRPEKITFTLLGYKTRTVPFGFDQMKVILEPEDLTLGGAYILSGDPKEILMAAIGKINVSFPQEPELLEGFFRETVQKNQRYTYVAEAVSKIYKSGYQYRGTARDRAALVKSRVLLSQRKSDTLSIKVQGGPTQSISHDAVKNPDILFDKELLDKYSYELGTPVSFDDRMQVVIKISPAATEEYPLYFGTIYIDQATLSFSRIELSLDMSDPDKVTKMILIKKPLSLRFRPREVSLVADYRMDGDVSRLHYIRTTMRFGCDWRKKLFSTNYTCVDEMVITDKKAEAIPIERTERFRPSDIMNDKASLFFDPEFWRDYNIIEPSESLENAIGRLRKRR